MLYCRSLFALMAPLIVVGVSTPAALAQQRIPQEVITATGSMSEDNRLAIETYIARWAGVLVEANTNVSVVDTAISEARDRLLSPMRTPGATDLFKTTYSRILVGQLDPLLQANRLIVRLNAMIIATKLTDESAANLARDGLQDASPSVRYWAGKALGSIASATDANNQAVLTIQTKLALLRELSDTGKDEPSAEVLQQILQAMAATDLPSAPDRVLELLSLRLRFHVDRPYEPYLAEEAGMRPIYTKLLRQNDAADPNHVRQLAGIAQRYSNLISRNLAEAREKAEAEGSENPINKQLEADHAAMLLLCDYALQFCHGQTRSAQPKPKPIDSDINFKNWREINSVAVNEWAKVLQAPPFSFKPGDLTIVDQP